MTASQAVPRVAPGERVLIGSGAAEPVSLAEAMTARADELRDINVLHTFTGDGACLQIRRGDAHTVVTAYGAAEPHAMGVHERTWALMNIAHPDWRDWLVREADRLQLTRRADR